MTLALVFPGQGSQKVGMGDTLFQKYRNVTDSANKILGYSIEDLCLRDSHAQLTVTEYTQPALYTVNALMYFDFREKNKEEPVIFAGHSLGEYNALLAAEAFDFETGLRLVKMRGELMNKASEGGMAAILGMNKERIIEVLQQNHAGSIDIANFNSPDQIIISGPKQDIENAQIHFENAGAKRYLKLNVGAAFHSRYMKNAQESFSNFLTDFQFKPIKVTVLSNYTAKPYGEDIRENLVQQISNSVHWEQSIRYALQKYPECKFEEIGPGKVLTGLVKQIRNHILKS